MGAKRSGGNLPDCRGKRPFTINPSGSPVTCASVTLPQYWFTINPRGVHQSPGSGNPTFGREAIRRESSRLQRQAPLHH
ncbi:MAG: hypothetical protein ACHBN1_25750 [Heteroscytonema crispum UTEX LB 1556]